MSFSTTILAVLCHFIKQQLIDTQSDLVATYILYLLPAARILLFA